MPQPFVGEIRMFAGSSPPRGWELCQGQPLSVDTYAALFDVLAYHYGGSGSTFNLPDLRGRVPVHFGFDMRLGQSFGEEEITLRADQLPIHTHGLLASQGAATASTPGGKVLARTNIPIYSGSELFPGLAEDSVTTVGGGKPHTNLQPYLCLNFMIALFGITPSTA